MLAATTATANSLNGREVIVAIVGGTMLTLALTRPRLAWVEQLTEDSSAARAWAERALTFFLLTMAGYAGFTLLAALHKQLGPESDALLKGAGLFLMAYAWLAHFEPFAREWRLRGSSGAMMLYTGVFGAAVLIGGLLSEIALRPWFSLPHLAVFALAAALAVFGCGMYKWAPDFRIPFDELLKKAAHHETVRSSDSPGHDEPN